MKAICLASAMTVILLALATLGFRFFPGRRRARQMTIIYLACLVALVGVWSATPDDLGFLSRSLITEPSWLDLPLAWFFFSAAFFGGALQLYNLAERGLSLRILIDVLEAPNESLDVPALMAAYGGGQGISGMYRKRIEGLIEAGFVRRAHDSIVLTAKGVDTAALFARIRYFLRLSLR
jgi:hypothetical protein